jgi:hypothetical protein
MIREVFGAGITSIRPKGQNQSGGLILGEKAMRATLEWLELVALALRQAQGEGGGGCGKAFL